jgi:hypothetical protein
MLADFPDNSHPAPHRPSAPLAPAVGSAVARETHPASLPALPCPRCGVIDAPSIAPGTGPHAYRADCRHCNGFVRWVSKYSAAERERRKEEARRTAMAALPPTARQLDWLVDLGYRGDAPASRLAASTLIDTLQQQRGRP